MIFLIIANPVSCGKKGKKQLPEIEKRLKYYNLNYNLKKTESYGHAEKIIEQTNIKQYDEVALIGGDGTNFQVLNGLIKNHDNNSLPPVAIIPAEINDGFFDIVIASKISLFKLLKAFPELFKGTRIDIDEITTIRTKKARLFTKKPLSMNPDGEIFGTTPTEINILPKKLNYFYLK